MDLDITDTITSVNPAEWENLTGSNCVETWHSWYRTAEDSGMMKMRYVFLRENGILKAAACCSLFTARLLTLEVPILDVSSPLGLAHSFFSSCSEHTNVLVEGLEEIREKEKAQGISISELRAKEYTSLKEQLKGFIPSRMPENTYIDLHFKTFDDFLTSLPEEAWRSARMTLNRARRWKIKPLFTNDFSRWKEVTHTLQGYLCEEHRDYRWHLPQQFYESVERNLKDTAELLLFFKEDVPLAFGLSLHTDETTFYKVGGVDPAHKKYHAYFLIYYEGIRRAVQRGHRRIYFGITTYDFKEKIGCKREPLYALVKLGNPLLNAALKAYGMLQPVKW